MPLRLGFVLAAIFLFGMTLAIAGYDGQGIPVFVTNLRQSLVFFGMLLMGVSLLMALIVIIFHPPKEGDDGGDYRE